MSDYGYQFKEKIIPGTFNGYNENKEGSVVEIWVVKEAASYVYEL